MPQTSVTTVPVKAYPGLLADDNDHKIDSAVVDESSGIKPGLVVMRTAGGDFAAGLPPAVADDTDSIKTNIGSTAGIQALTTADFNGDVGAGRISPPGIVELVLSNHADWDATNATLTGLDENGIPVSELLAIPNNGNATVKSTKYYSRVLTLGIPAQSGVGGTATLGVAADVTLDGGDVLGVAVRSQKALITPSSTDNEIYENDDVMPVLERGHIYVQVENAFRAGDIAMVRVAAGTGTQRGAIRAHDNDTSTCIPWKRARLLTSGIAGDFGVLQVR